MDSKQDATVFEDNDLTELKPESEFKKAQMTMQQQEISSYEIKEECGAGEEISGKDSTYLPHKTNYLEGGIFVKKEFTLDKDIQVTHNLFKPEVKCLKDDAIDFKQ